jgi:hypothetical protein
MAEVLAALLPAIIAALSPVIVALIGVLSAKLVELINAKAKNETVKGILARLTEAVTDSVGEVYQTEAEALKEAMADGKLTEEEKARLRQIAIDHAKSYLGPKGLAELMAVLGLATEGDADKVIGGKVEKAIYDAKRAGSNRIGRTTAAM